MNRNMLTKSEIGKSPSSSSLSKTLNFLSFNSRARKQRFNGWRRLLSLYSISKQEIDFWMPPIILIPQLESFPTPDNNKHFISRREFELYKLRNGTGSTSIKTESTGDVIVDKSDAKSEASSYKWVWIHFFGAGFSRVCVPRVIWVDGYGLIRIWFARVLSLMGYWGFLGFGIKNCNTTLAESRGMVWLFTSKGVTRSFDGHL